MTTWEGFLESCLDRAAGAAGSESSSSLWMGPGSVGASFLASGRALRPSNSASLCPTALLGWAPQPGGLLQGRCLHRLPCGLAVYRWLHPPPATGAETLPGANLFSPFGFSLNLLSHTGKRSVGSHQGLSDYTGLTVPHLPVLAARRYSE